MRTPRGVEGQRLMKKDRGSGRGFGRGFGNGRLIGLMAAAGITSSPSLSKTKSTSERSMSMRQQKPLETNGNSVEFVVPASAHIVPLMLLTFCGVIMQNMYVVVFLKKISNAHPRHRSLSSSSSSNHHRPPLIIWDPGGPGGSMGPGWPVLVRTQVAQVAPWGQGGQGGFPGYQRTQEAGAIIHANAMLCYAMLISVLCTG